MELTQSMKDLLIITALARIHEIDAEIEHRRKTGHMTEKWCMFSFAALAHEANKLEEAIDALR